MKTLNQIEKLCEQIDKPQVFETLKVRLAELESPKIRLSVIGGTNVGKSSLINKLAEVKLPVSTIPSNSTHVIVTEPLSDMQQDNVYETNSEWMKGHNLEIWEIAELNATDETPIIDLGLHFMHSDICIMIISAMSALNRSEMKLLESLNHLEIPTILMISKVDQMEEEGRKEVHEYVASKVSKFSCVKLISNTTGEAVFNLADDLHSLINEMLVDSDSIKQSRVNLGKLFYTDALAALYENCNAEIEKVEATLDKVDKMTADKRSKLSEDSTAWLTIQTDLLKRKADFAETLRNALEEKKNDSLRQLSHQLDMCSDIKAYWEKEFPYQLENVLKVNSQTTSQLINKDAMNTIQWLNTQVYQKFKKNLNAVPHVSCSLQMDSRVNTANEDVNIADNNRLRIIARIGTVATVITSGVILASASIAGVAMAASMLAGIGSEILMKRKIEESRVHVQEKLPLILEKAHQTIVSEATENISSLYDNIMQELQSYQNSWQEDVLKEIEREHQMAIYNVNATIKTWKKRIEEINELANDILD